MNDLRNINIDKFTKFVFEETDWMNLALIIQDMGEKYLKENIPEITVGQNVWVIIGAGQSAHIVKGQVTRIQYKKRYSFVIHYDNREAGAAYSKNSIGKKVFFSEDEALKALEEMRNAKNA